MINYYLPAALITAGIVTYFVSYAFLGLFFKVNPYRIPYRILRDVAMEDIEKIEVRVKRELNTRGKGVYPLDKEIDTVKHRFEKIELPIIIGRLKESPKKIITADLADLVHLMVSGASGWGKSVFLRSLINTTLISETDKKVYLIDAQGVEFYPYRKIRDVKVSTNEDEAMALLDEIIAIQKRRKQVFMAASANEFKEFNKNANAKEKIPRIVVIIDEYADYVEVDGFQKKVSTLARVCRKYGIHIVLTTQRPSAKLINEQIKAQFVNKIIFKASDGPNARVLGDMGALTIEKKGEAITWLNTKRRVVQTPLQKKFFSKKLMEKIDDQK